jgi:thiol-disulfide isomerase/thioredoxin
MKFPSVALKWFVPVVGLLAVALWVVSPSLKGAEETSLPKNQSGGLGIIREGGIVPGAATELPDLTGQSFRIADFKGKIVLLNLWASWCPDCRREMPSLEKLQNALGRKDFAVVAIDLRESRDKVAKFVKEHGLTFEVLLDHEGKMGEDFRIRSIPTTFILGRNGGLLGRVMGARDWDQKESVALFRNVIRTGQLPDPAARTKSR